MLGRGTQDMPWAMEDTAHHPLQLAEDISDHLVQDGAEVEVVLEVDPLRHGVDQLVPHPALLHHGRAEAVRRVQRCLHDRLKFGEERGCFGVFSIRMHVVSRRRHVPHPRAEADEHPVLPVGPNLDLPATGLRRFFCETLQLVLQLAVLVRGVSRFVQEGQDLPWEERRRGSSPGTSSSLSILPRAALHPWLPHGRVSPGETFWLCWAPHGPHVPPDGPPTAPHHSLTLLPPLCPAVLVPTLGEILSHLSHHLFTTSTILFNSTSTRLSAKRAGKRGAKRAGKKEKEVV